MDEWPTSVSGADFTDRQLAIGADDATTSSATERCIDQPAQAGAALTCVPGRGEHDAAHRQLQVGRRRHTAALLPPNSSSTRPKRRATRDRPAGPSVADNNTNRGSSTSSTTLMPPNRPPTRPARRHQRRPD